MTFEELSKRFQTDFPNLEVAKGELFHYIKLFQHASSYHALNDERKLITKTIDQPEYLLRLKYAVKQLLRRPKPISLRSVVMLDDKRTAESAAGRKSFYFDRILSEIGEDSVSVINDSYKQTALPTAVDRSALWTFDYSALDRVDILLLRDLQEVLRNVRKVLSNDNQLYKYLASAFTVFFADFHRYHHLLRNQRVECFLFTTHYHREGLIAAAKLNGVRTIEFQHGLIARQDLYYAYPSKFARFMKEALFADDLCVFGNYWKSVLAAGCEYPPDRIHVVGDYSLRAKGMEKYKGQTKVNALLIAAQKNCVDEYVAYAKSLFPLFEAKYPEWQVWVKLHPLEKKPEAYQVLSQHPQCTVFGKESNLMEILCKCKVQVSIYSTTLYDALGLGIVNLSLQNYGRSSDYAKAMVNEKVALGLAFGDDPVAKALEANDMDLVHENDVYAEFNPSTLHSLLHNIRV